MSDHGAGGTILSSSTAIQNLKGELNMTEISRSPRYRRPVARTPWSEADTAEVARLWIAGATASQIAKSIGKSRNSVLGKIGRLGLKRNGNGVTGQSYRRPRRSSGRRRARVPASQWFRWTQEHEARLEEHWLEGLTAGEIAARFGCTEGAVSARAARLGLVRAEYPERYASAQWFAENDARFVAAMRKALASGALQLPIDVTCNEIH